MPGKKIKITKAQKIKLLQVVSDFLYGYWKLGFDVGYLDGYKDGNKDGLNNFTKKEMRE